MVTSGTYKKEHLLSNNERKSLVQEKLFELADEFDWRLQAWAILSNHYHFIAMSPEDPGTLKSFIWKLHGVTAREINRMDNCARRKVWFQYYDTRISYQKSYLARLKYVHTNPVHHGIVKNAEDYQWCSATWFQQSTSSAFTKTVNSFKIDKLNVYDDF